MERLHGAASILTRPTMIRTQLFDCFKTKNTKVIFNTILTLNSEYILDFNWVNDNGCSVLLEACKIVDQNEALKIVKYALRFGAEMGLFLDLGQESLNQDQETKSDCFEPNKINKMTLWTIQALFKNDHDEILKYLINFAKDPSTKIYENNFDLNIIVDPATNKTLFHSACSFGAIKCCIILLKHVKTINVNLLLQEDNYGRNCLHHIAIGNDFSDLINHDELDLYKIVNWVNPSETDLLDKRKGQLLNFLLETCPDLIDKQDKINGETVLHYCCRLDKKLLLINLVGWCKKKKYQRTYAYRTEKTTTKGQTCINLACTFASKSAFRILVSNDPDLINTRQTKNKYTPIHNLLDGKLRMQTLPNISDSQDHKNRLDLMQELIDLGADTSKKAGLGQQTALEMCEGNPSLIDFKSILLLNSGEEEVVLYERRAKFL